MSMLLRQAKVISPSSSFHGQVVDIFIENGKISSIGKNLDIKAATEMDTEGLCISNGWIDVFADYREPGYEQKETIGSGLDAAAAGGFAHVCLLPNTNPVIDTKSGIQAVLQRAEGHRVKLHPFGAASKGVEGKSLAEMLDMRAHGAVAFTDGWHPVQSSNLMLKALEYVKAFNGIIVQMPVDAGLTAGGLMHEGDISTRLGMPGIPTLAETLMVHRDIELLRYTGSRLHITGITTAESVAMIRSAKSEGLDVSCAVTPYHLALTDEALLSYDSLYKVTPPLRSEADRQALIAGLQDGTIDCISSHHRPQDWDAKTKEFEYAGEGMNVQEMVFPIVWDAIGAQVSLERIVDALTVAPARIFGIESISPEHKNEGAFTIFTTAATSTFQQKDLKSKGMNNPFLNREMKGKVLGITS